MTTLRAEGDSHVMLRPSGATPGELPNRRFRLGGLSRLVLLAMLAATTTIVFSGAARYESNLEIRPYVTSAEFDAMTAAFSGNTDWQLPIREHGWPLVFLRRFQDWSQNTTPPSRALSLAWTWPQAWTFKGGTYYFEISSLLVDAAIGIALVICVVAGCEHWRRKRGRWRFSLFDMAVVATLACAALGWWRFHVRTHDREQAILNPVSPVGDVASWSLAGWYDQGGPSGTADSEFCGPQWLARLSGDHPFFHFCHHTVSLRLNPQGLTSDDVFKFRELAHVQRFGCAGRLTPELVESLAALPELREARWTSSKQFAAARRRHVDFFRRTSARSAAAAGNARHHQLRTLRGRPGDLKAIAPTAVANYFRRQFLVEDLEVLAALPALQIIHARISATDEEQQAFVAAHPQLSVDWPDLPLRQSVEPYLSDPLFVAHVRINRWRGEDGPGPDALSRRPVLNLSGLLLTANRLQQIPREMLVEMNEVRLGDSDSPATAIDLIERSPQVEYIDMRNIPIDRNELARLCRNDMLRSLRIQQGLLTVEDVCQLARLPKFKWLEVYASSFCYADAELIRDTLRLAAPDAVVAVFSGFRDEPDGVIFSTAD